MPALRTLCVGELEWCTGLEVFTEDVGIEVGGGFVVAFVGCGFVLVEFKESVKEGGAQSAGKSSLYCVVWHGDCALDFEEAGGCHL